MFTYLLESVLAPPTSNCPPGWASSLGGWAAFYSWPLRTARCLGVAKVWVPTHSFRWRKP